MSTIESRPVDQFSHSNLIKVGLFCQYIHDNWTPETNLRLISLGYWEGEITFSFESTLGELEVSLDLNQDLPEIGMYYVTIYGGSFVDNIPLRHMVGNY